MYIPICKAFKDMFFYVYAEKALSQVENKDIHKNESIPQMRCEKVSGYTAKMQSTQAYAKSN